MSYQSSVIILSDKHKYMDLVFVVYYSILLHVSAVHISHQQVGLWFTERVNRGEASLYKQWLQKQVKLSRYRPGVAQRVPGC